MTSDDDFSQFVFTEAERLAALMVPGGVATGVGMDFTSAAFDYYVAHHGVPTTANEARQMFEFAAVIDQTAAFFLGKRR